MRVGLVLGLCLVVGSAGVRGQAPSAAAAPSKSATGTTFEVATIKPSAPLDPIKMQADMRDGKMPRFGAHVDGLRAQYFYETLKDLVAEAYKVKPYQVTGPDWMGSTRFDVVATMPEGSTKDDAPKMLRALLAERFKMVSHEEKKEQPVLALVVGKGGPKLKESEGKPVPIDPDAPLKPGEMKMDSPEGQVRVTPHSDGSATVNMGEKGVMTQRLDTATQTLHIDSSMVTMEGFADMLTRMTQIGGSSGKQVVDMTGLKGNYQVGIELSIVELMNMARAQGMNFPGGGAAPQSNEASDPGGGGSSVYQSVEKLGLKLEPRRAPVDQVIVESVEKTPTEN